MGGRRGYALRRNAIALRARKEKKEKTKKTSEETRELPQQGE